MSPFRRAAIAALATGVGLGLATVPTSAAELPDEFTAAVEAAGQPAAQPNPDVQIPRDADDPVVTALGDATVTMTLPASGSGQALGTAGTLVFGGDGTAVAAEPTADGVRALVRIDDASGADRYAFDLGGDVAGLETAEDGSVSLLDADGLTVGEIDAPWARDAAGEPVATHYEVSGTTLTQVVEHTAPGVTYPVVADPRVFRCDLYINWCVKFSKSETRSIASKAGIPHKSFVAAMCGLIPNKAIAVACTAIGSVVAGRLKNLFRTASADGRCAQIHFTNGGIPIRWKAVRC